MRKIYLHIGFGKTGSSSLQSFLSFNPEFQHRETQEKFLYCCILKDGKILTGNELKRRAGRSKLKYLASAPVIANIESLGLLKSELDGLFEAGYSPIFSNEDWWQRVGDFTNLDFFNRLDVLADVIVYVRPQVEWFNSAWWQWFVWNKSFKKPQDVIDAWGYNFMLWSDLISKWRGVDGVDNITVRLQPNDIIEDFLGLFNHVPAPGMSQKYRVNISLPPILIKFLLRYPFLRGKRTAHVDMMLSSFLKFDGKSPWVIDTELGHRIITTARVDNEELLGILDEASRKIMKKDPRWWDAEYYKSRYVSTEKDLELTGDELRLIIGQTFRSLINWGK